MRRIIRLAICIGLLAVCGCATKNYTWTPTAEEWARMTVAERNAWSANEMQARQNASTNLRKLSQAFQQLDRQPEVTVIPGGQGYHFDSGAWRYYPERFSRERDNSTYWQEKNAEDQYRKRHFGFSIP